MNTFFRPAMILLVLIAVYACDSTEPSEPDTAAPTNLRVSSDSGALVVGWTPSTSVGQSHFAGYSITVTDPSGYARGQYHAGKDSIFRVPELVNGDRYHIAVQARSTSGNLSPDQATIEWAPAERRTRDIAGQPIRVYAVTSKNYPCAVDLWNAEGMAEPLRWATEDFQRRASFYVHTLGTSYGLLIRSPHLAFVPGPQTMFADVASGGNVAEANNLNEHLSAAPPDTSAYTASYINVPNGTLTKGRIYFGRLPRPEGDLYFRLFLKRGPNGRLVHGAGDDRFIEIEVSIQGEPGNRFVKR